MTKEVILASWCLSDNFGDKLTRYMVEKISKKTCLWSPPESDLPKFVVTGSILNWDIKNATVWGAGIANKNDNVEMKNILAVRGEISRYAAIVSGVKTKIEIGDPALLLPKYYSPAVKKKYSIGIFPHYADMDVVLYYLHKKLPSDCLIINPLDEIEKVIDQICSCDKIISSSLHGIIVSDAYDIPSQWVKFTDRVLGDGTKFMDYFSSIKYDISSPPVDFRNKVSNLSEIMKVKVVRKYSLDINLDKLLKCCPFK